MSNEKIEVVFCTPAGPVCILFGDAGDPVDFDGSPAAVFLMRDKMQEIVSGDGYSVTDSTVQPGDLLQCEDSVNGFFLISSNVGLAGRVANDAPAAIFDSVGDDVVASLRAQIAASDDVMRGLDLARQILASRSGGATELDTDYVYRGETIRPMREGDRWRWSVPANDGPVMHDSRAEAEAAVDAKVSAARQLTPGDATAYRYALVDRPASFETLPKDLRYTLLPRPDVGRVSVLARHGILVTARELTVAEASAAGAIKIPSEADTRAVAEEAARGMSEYASSYLEAFDGGDRGPVDGFVQNLLAKERHANTLHEFEPVADLAVQILKRQIAAGGITAEAGNDAWMDLDRAKAMLDGANSVELMARDVPGIIGPKVERLEAMKEGWPADALGAFPEGLLSASKSLMARWHELRKDGPQGEMGRGEANQYLRDHKGLDDAAITAILAKPTSVQRSTGLKIDIPRYTVEYLNAAAAAATDPKSAQRTADIAVLQSVIDGTADMYDVDLMERLAQIVEAYAEDAEVQALAAQAGEICTKFMLDMIDQLTKR